MKLDRCAFTVDGRAFSKAEVLALAHLAGSLRPTTNALADALAIEALAAAEELEVEQDEVQPALDAWRTERDLIAASETEAWLADHGLSLEDAVAHLERRLLAQRLAPRREEALARFPPPPRTCPRSFRRRRPSTGCSPRSGRPPRCGRRRSRRRRPRSSRSAG